MLMDPCVYPVQLDSENSGKDQSEPCPFSFGNQDMFGVSGASQTLPSPLSQSLLLCSLSLERVKVRGASRERGEETNTEKPPKPGNSPLAFYLQKWSPGFI